MKLELPLGLHGRAVAQLEGNLKASCDGLSEIVQVVDGDHYHNCSSYNISFASKCARLQMGFNPEFIKESQEPI